MIVRPSPRRCCPRTETLLLLTGFSGASVLGRVALGPRAGARVCGAWARSRAATACGPRRAQLGGIGKHTQKDVWIAREPW